MTIFLFAAFLHVVLPFCWYCNKVAINFEAGRIGCSTLAQQDFAELARFAVVELEFAFTHQFGHHLLVHGHEEEVIEIGDDN